MHSFTEQLQENNSQINKQDQTRATAAKICNNDSLIHWNKHTYLKKGAEKCINIKLRSAPAFMWFTS